MKLFAFKQKATGRFITGTDFGNGKRQMFNNYHAPLIVTDFSVETEILTRSINLKYYDVVEIVLIVK